MRRGRRKGASKDKVFGCDLLEHLAASSQEIPQVLRCCSEFIEEHGIVDGIYRLSGVSSNIQKLRSEFDGEGTPDLCKDVYLQDIHCISSLCKAYFRELPNPLLTYQLYDKFADAVAVQLEEERLVKIKEVLKDLPPPHYRTLEFLMRHLVKMSTFASQTNMHARNLAIVWAPNLLRSKDIEASGFNGTAAFMEVRVQSIVVEFILTHVTELFPIPGQPSERRKSLPSPSVMANQEDPFFRTVPLQLPSALSPGDGPPPMRPYHSIIESTDKRKGSLKGRKWKSIFNLGGRLQDPRRKNKVTCKDKEKVGLRPAKSMDSLSSVPYSHEGGRAHPSPSPPLGREAGSSGGVLGGAGSAYAVTYRRGGGASVSVVSGGGTQGTYSRLDSGGGSTADGLPPPRSPGLSSRAERRAGIHISGPFSVTVPLHITSGLALGVLQGGAQREEGGAQREEGGAQTEEGWAQREEGRTEKEVDGAENDEGGAQREEGGAQREEGGTQREEGRKVGKEVDGAEMERGSVKIEVCIFEKEESREWREGEKHREERKEGAVDRKKGENRIVEGEDRCSDAVGIKESLSVEEEEEPAASPGTVQQGLEEEEPDYMDMRAGMVQIPLDEQLPLDFQDTFGFLDLMDNSTYNQVNEFSVEPPCYEEEEDDEEQSGYLGGAPSAQSPQWSALPIQTYRSVTFDPNSRACKSHSLPYKSQSFLPATSFSSSEDEDDGSEEEDGSDEENDRFFCSLPDSLQFQALIQRDMARDANAGYLSSPDLHAPRQERTGTNGHGSSDSSTCEGLQVELESSLPLMDTDRAGGEGGFSDREAQASQWAQTDKMEDRPTHTEEHTKMEDRPTHTEEHTKMEDRPTHTEEHTKMEDRPPHTEEHTKMEDRPTQTEKHTKMEDRPPHTEEHTKMEDRPTVTEEHTKMEDRPTVTEEHTKMEDRPTVTEEHTKMEDNSPHTEEHTKMEDRPPHTEEDTKMEDRPPHTEEHTKMEDRPPHTEEHTKMEDRPTHTEEHTKMKDRLTHTEEHTKMEDRPPHTEEHTKNEDRPPHTEEHTKMEDRPTLSEERTKMEDRPPHTEEHTKMEDRPTLSEEYTNTARAERDHVATWTDTPGLGCGEAEASLTESEEEYEEDENPSVLEHSERDCPAEPRISEHCERDCPAEPRISEHCERDCPAEPRISENCERDCPAEPRISENCERDCPAEPRISENCERDCPAEPRISEHCERDCPADRPAQHTDSGLIGTAGGCQGNTVDQGGCHGDLANRTTQVAEPSLCLLEPQFFLIEPPLSEPQLVYDSHLEQVTIPEEKPPTSVDELEQTCWEGGGQIEREQAREGVGEKNTEDKEEKEKRKEEVGEKLERGVSSGAPGDVNRVRDLRKERGSKEERGGSEQLSHGVGERAAPAPQEDKELQRRSVKEGGERGEAAAGGMGPGVGRALVRSKQTLPKLHQAKAVPVVPPKPQTCKLAALNLRQQLHQRELERGKEGEAERAREERRETEGQGDGKKASRMDGEEEEEQYKAAKDGGTEIQLERWGEDGRDVEKEVKRSSGISICFDEAVARATEKREREKERGRDGERERRREGEMERRKEEEMERRREGEMEKGRDGERERRREGEREREGGREGEREK